MRDEALPKPAFSARPSFNYSTQVEVRSSERLTPVSYAHSQRPVRKLNHPSGPAWSLRPGILLRLLMMFVSGLRLGTNLLLMQERPELLLLRRRALMSGKLTNPKSTLPA